MFCSTPSRAPFAGRVQSIGPDRVMRGGPAVNRSETRRFEPPRAILVRIELERVMEAGPHAVRVGGKAQAVIFAESETGPAAWIARGLQRLRS